MDWKLKVALALVVALLVGGCGLMGYLVRARSQGNEYVVQLTAAFNAASLLNGQETYTDAERAVICRYQGASYVILPENYKALVSLLTKNHAMPMFRRVGRDAPLQIELCGAASVRIQPDRDSVDGALIAFTNDKGHCFTMHVRGGNIVKQLVEYATVGHSQNKNLPVAG